MTNDAPPATLTIPLISGRVAGPLGIRHLPRLWYKLRLFAHGRLPEGYRHGDGGSDAEIIDTLGLDRGALLRFVARDEPDHQAFEAWIRANGAHVPPPNLAAFNAAFDTFEMPEPRRTEWTARFGCPNYTVATRLNELDDWDLVHAQLVAPGAPSTVVIPAISTSVTGPLGVMHLPRLWLKKLLAHVGRLPEGYRHGIGGFDQLLLEALGVDNDAFDEYLRVEQPGYLATESWVRERATSCTPGAMAEFNAYVSNHTVPEDRAAPRREKLGLDPSINSAILLNDTDDWYQLHEQLIAPR
jgi:hypothetical protein